MNVIEELLSNRWIIKSENPKLYYEIKDNAKEIRKKMQDKFGFSLIVNPLIAKLEKIPGKAEGWMGIQAFTTVLEYRMFCFLLMFLEEKEQEEQFVLSSLTEFIQVQFSDGEISWTNIRHRRGLVRVLQYAIKNKLILRYDGDEEYFLKDEHSEALYENTGISKYFMRNFMRDIMEFTKPEDFEQSEWIDMEEDRGIVRRQRIYRRLILSCGIYRDSKKDSEDFNYIRNYRRNIELDFQGLFPSQLHVHASSAFLVLEEDCSLGMTFPRNYALHDILLLTHYDLRKRIKQSQLQFDEHEIIQLSVIEYERIIKRLICKYNEKLPKKYQSISIEPELLAKTIRDLVISLGFAEIEGDCMYLYPILGKIQGCYREE